MQKLESVCGLFFVQIAAKYCVCAIFAIYCSHNIRKRRTTVQEFDYPFDGAMILQKKRSLKRVLLEKKEDRIHKKIAIMSGSTIGDIQNIMELFLLNDGISPAFYVGGYAQFYENLVFDDGGLAAFAPDVIYIHTSNQNIVEWPTALDDASMIEQKFASECARFAAVWRAAERFNCPVIQNNFELPSLRVMGNRDAVDAHGRVNFVNRLNAYIAETAAKTPNFYLHDLCYLSASVGLDNWFSPAIWYAYKYAMDTQYIALLCHSVTRIVKSLFGKNKKAVVLDLDNTLWGGVIGDDGAEGLALGKETPAGMAYSAFQAYLKELSSCGVMLAVSSKNDDAVARTGFARSESVLKLEDFVCFKANWEPKSHNIIEIANTINILPDSLVFMDDNPVEREIVLREVAGVTVPILFAPEMYPSAIDKNGWFEVTMLSDDDRKRGEMVRQNQERAALETNFGDYSDYLRSLAMHCNIGAFDSAHAERITQLINKTNQFNLTTHRYTAAEIDVLCTDDNVITLYGQLVDKFGDNGIVTALIAHKNGCEATIDLWIMSCRTFKRDLELAMFDRLVTLCREAGICKINGAFYPTAKNLLVSDFYGTIGFEKASDTPEGKTFIFTAFEGYEPQNKVMETVLL